MTQNKLNIMLLLLIPIPQLLNLYLKNLTIVLFGEIAAITLVATLLSTISVIIFYTIYRKFWKALLFSTYSMIFFYYFHELLEAINEYTLNHYSAIFFKLRYIVAITAIGFAIIFYKILDS